MYSNNPKRGTPGDPTTPQEPLEDRSLDASPGPVRSSSVSLLFALHRSASDANWLVSQIEDRVQHLSRDTTVHLWKECMIPGDLPQDFVSYLKFLETRGLYTCPERAYVSDMLAVTDTRFMTAEFRTKLEAAYLSEAYCSREEATTTHAIPAANMREAIKLLSRGGNIYDFPDFDVELMAGVQKLQAKGIRFEIKMERPSFDAFMAHIGARYYGFMAFSDLQNGNEECALRSLLASTLSDRLGATYRESKIASDITSFSTAHPQDVNILTFGLFHSEPLTQEFEKRGVSARVSIQPRFAPLSLTEDSTFFDGVRYEPDGTIPPETRQLLIKGLMKSLLEGVVLQAKSKQQFVRMTSEIISTLHPQDLNDWMTSLVRGMYGGDSAEKVSADTHQWLKRMAPDHLQSAYKKLRMK